MRQPAISVQLELKFESKKKCQSIMNALIADNQRIPEGLALRLDSVGSVGSVTITGSPQVTSSTLVSTLDEILEHISLAEGVIPK